MALPVPTLPSGSTLVVSTVNLGVSTLPGLLSFSGFTTPVVAPTANLRARVGAIRTGVPNLRPATATITGVVLNSADLSTIKNYVADPEWVFKRAIGDAEEIECVVTDYNFSDPRGSGVTSVAISLLAIDPRWRKDVLDELTVNYLTGVTGSGDTLTYGGDYASLPTCTVTAGGSGMTSPRVDINGVSMSIPGLTLTSGQSVIFNTEDRTVTGAFDLSDVNDGYFYNDYRLLAGDNEIFVRSDVASETGTLVVSYREYYVE